MADPRKSLLAPTSNYPLRPREFPSKQSKFERTHFDLLSTRSIDPSTFQVLDLENFVEGLNSCLALLFLF